MPRVHPVGIPGSIGAAPVRLDVRTTYTVRAFILFILSCAAVLAGDLGASTNRIGEALVSLKAGEDTRGIVSYGLFSAVSASRAASNAPAGSSLFLILRNTGAKSLNMENTTVDDFGLQDAQGKPLKLYLWSPPRTMAYGDSTVVHLAVDGAREAPQPWTLRFKTKPHAFVPFEITITGIEPRNK